MRRRRDNLDIVEREIGDCPICGSHDADCIKKWVLIPTPVHPADESACCDAEAPELRRTNIAALAIACAACWNDDWKITARITI